MELGMWVVVGRSTTNVVCHHKMCIFLKYYFNTLLSYLFCPKTWCVDSGGYENLPCVPVITKCTYLIPPLQVARNHSKAHFPAPAAFLTIIILNKNNLFEFKHVDGPDESSMPNSI